MEKHPFELEPMQLFRSLADALRRRDVEMGSAILAEQYPFQPVQAYERRYSALQCMRLYLRDGFVDRYSGVPLVNPGVFRLLSWWMPEPFPFHPHWKMSETHPAYYEYFPTVDHLFPIARGGKDGPENWVTTSMLRNSAKANSTLAQLGWELHPPGTLDRWDGLSRWLVEQWKDDPGWTLLPDAGRSTHQTYVNRWCRATMSAWPDGAPMSRI